VKPPKKREPGLTKPTLQKNKQGRIANELQGFAHWVKGAMQLEGEVSRELPCRREVVGQT